MWKRLAFGLKNAPAIFQCTMQVVLGDIKVPQNSGIRVCLDDILLFASHFQDFVGLLDVVLHQVPTHGLKVSLEKCRYGLSRIHFLGYILCSEGKLPDPSRVKAMLCIPRPQNRKQLLSWVQTANFYRRFIKNFSRISSPLYPLVKSPEWYWNSSCEHAFHTLRMALTEDTPDEKKLHSNAWECIAVHWAITQRWRHNLLNRKFRLVTYNWTVACL
ncbi:uncharacterized protein LOC135389402 [Ornithodoros turicata]|uniref:uncharacterized protein LOC135389402 n=1 Tax=Ornithodoros turicata TaxID=34597 RepID=UPI003139023A